MMQTSAASDGGRHSMQELTEQSPFLATDQAGAYRLPEGTRFLLRAESDLGRLVGDPALAREWAKKQHQLMRWTRDDAMFNEAEVSFNHAMYERFFAVRGPLTGQVLDVGGGWGLFRQWWSASDGECFVVHDPGSERFMAPPPPTVLRIFAAGLARPVWFVEGYGEQMPYQDGRYDLVMIAAALDHCADPARVMRECRRVLKSGGRLIIIQGFDPEHGEAPREGTDLYSRLKRVLSDPRRLYRAIKQRIFHRGEPHIHHFTRESLNRLISEGGFTESTETVLNVTHGVSVFEAIRS